MRDLQLRVPLSRQEHVSQASSDTRPERNEKAVKFPETVINLYLL